MAVTTQSGYDTTAKGLEPRILSPGATIAYVVLLFSIPLLCLGFCSYLRFVFHWPGKLRTTASRIADALFLILLVSPPGAIGLCIWVNVRSIQAENDPGNISKLQTARRSSFMMDLFNSLAYAFVLWSVKGIFMCIYTDVRAMSHVPILTRRIIAGTSVFLVITFLASLGISALWCLPISTNWSLERDHCSVQSNAIPIILVSSMHISTDLLVLSIPILLIRHIPLHRKDRSAFAFIFLLGVLTVGAGVVSFGLRIEAQMSAGKPRPDELRLNELFVQEEMRRIEKVRLAAYAESAVAIFTANLPGLRLAFRRWSRSWDKGSSDDKGKWRAYMAMKRLRSKASGEPLRSGLEGGE